MTRAGIGPYRDRGARDAQPPSARRTSCGRASSPGTTPATSAALAKRIFANSGVRTRQAAVNPLLEDVSDWPTERRMRRYQVEAMPLGKEAVGRALTAAGRGRRRRRPVRGLLLHRLRHARAWTSCSPGTWAWPPDTQRLFVGHMGCYAALPGPGRGGRLRRRPRPAGAAALRRADQPAPPAGAAPGWTPSRSSRTRSSRTPRPPPWSCRAAPGVRGARGRRRHRHHDRRPHDLGRHRPRLPDGAVAAGAAGAVGARPRAGRRPAGPARPDRSRRGRLGGAPGRAADPGRGGGAAGAAAEALAASRAMLAEHGNCSSPTVLLILDRLRPGRRRRPARRHAGLRPRPDPLRRPARSTGLTLAAGTLAGGYDGGRPAALGGLFGAAVAVLAVGGWWWRPPRPRRRPGRLPLAARAVGRAERQHAAGTRRRQAEPDDR